MSYYHLAAEGKFKQELKRKEVQYRNAGMSEEAILLMREYDRKVFNSDRRFYVHNRLSSTLPTLGIKDILEDALTIRDERGLFSREWIELIESPTLLNSLKSLSPVQLDLVNLVYIDRTSIKYASEFLGLSYDTAKRQMRKIKKLIQ